MADCYARSLTILGSSDHYPESTTGTNFTNYDLTLSGRLDPDPTNNPVFYAFNRLRINYCDGYFFAGNLNHPYQYTADATGSTPAVNTTLYFRGRAILDAVFETINQKYNISSASEVLLEGTSAGGISTFYHAKHIKDTFLSSVPKFKASPISGWFPTVYPVDSYVFAIENRSLVARGTMQEMNATLDNECWHAHPPNERRLCFSVNTTFSYNTLPFLVINSVVDWYALTNLWAPRALVPEYDACLGIPPLDSSFQNCATYQLAAVKKRADAIMHLFDLSGQLSRPGNGAFLHTCFEHVAPGISTYYDGYTMNGTSIKDLSVAWWAASDSADPAQFVYRPCTLHDTQPYQCMPSCAEYPWPPLPQDNNDSGDGTHKGISSASLALAIVFSIIGAGLIAAAAVLGWRSYSARQRGRRSDSEVDDALYENYTEDGPNMDIGDVSQDRAPSGL